MPAARNQGFLFQPLSNGWTVGTFGAFDSRFVNAVTTREGFDVQQALWSPAATAENVAQALSLSGVAYCKQVHGGEVLTAEGPGLAGEGDALVAEKVGLGVLGFTADCPIVLVADPKTGAVGMAHGSWRSTVSNITRKMISRMADSFGADPADAIACIAPSAGPCCYEVGEDVRRTAMERLGADAAAIFFRASGRTSGGEKFLFDLWAANIAQLLAGGLRRENVQVAGLCTICEGERFSSFRREGQNAGRCVAIIGCRYAR